MTAEVVPTPDAKRADAIAKIKAREDGIRANAIRQGREAERRELMEALGAQTLADASQVAQIRKERDARPTHAEEAKHGRFRFYQGGFLGLIIGMSIAAIIASLLLQESFRQAANYGREMTMTGALTQSVAPPTRCIPGETLPDGRRCPEAPPAQTERQP